MPEDGCCLDPEANDRDCISPLAELLLHNVALQPHLRSKVLLTTRLSPHVLEAKGGGFLQGCREEELRQMQPADAVEFFRAQGIRGTHTEIEQASALAEKEGNKRNVAVGLGNMAHMAQIHIGALRAAEANLRRSIALCREIKDEFIEAVGHQELGWLLAYRGAYPESEMELATALETDEKLNHVQCQGVTWAYRAQRELLRLRHAEVPQSSIPTARRALELADEDALTVSPVECDYVRAHWLLGAPRRRPA